MLSRLLSLIKEVESTRISETTRYSSGVASSLQRVEKFCYSSSGRPNRWVIGPRTFVFEWPDIGEAQNGAVSGDVYEIHGVTSVVVGSYRIDGTGKILNFPFLPLDELSK